MILSAALAALAAATSVGVGEREFSLAVYRVRVPTGRVRFNVKNFGEDPHDLAIRGPRPSSRVLGRTPEIKPGDAARLSVVVRRSGRYVLLCTLPRHAERGMRQTITVVRRRR